VRQAAEGGQPALPIADFAQPVVPISTEASLDSLLGFEPLRDFGALMAVDADGRLRGVLTAEQAARALRARLSTPA
jgi:hypothetical protein